MKTIVSVVLALLATIGFASAAMNSSIEITSIDAINEMVFLKNTGNEPIVLSGWFLEDNSSRPHKYIFGNFTLSGNAEVTINSGKGQDTSSNLFMNRGRGIWNDEGDMGILCDAEGNIISFFSYPTETTETENIKESVKENMNETINTTTTQ